MYRPFVLRLMPLFLPVALLVGGAALFGYRVESARRHTTHVVRERARILAGVVTLASNLVSLNRDLLYLARQESLGRAMSGEDPSAMDRTTRGWIEFSRSKQIYDQLRWLDEHGKERIRVDYAQESPAAAPEASLQDKSSRYYFVNTAGLDEGEVYVSPMDLNVENDRIEVPFKPTLRLATPVFDHRGQRRGIVVVNYRGAALLALYAQATSSLFGHAWLVNDDGYWLKGTAPADEWGFMFGRTDLNLAHRHPDAWQRMSRADSGGFETLEGLWTFQAVVPPFEGGKGFGWKAVSLLPRAQLEGGLFGLAAALGGATAALLSLWLFACWRLVQARVAEEGIRAGLEEMVAERSRDLVQKNDELTESMIEQKRIMGESFRLWTAIEQAAESVVITDPLGTIQYVNPAFTSITGFTAQEALGANPRMLKSDRHDAAFYENLWSTLGMGKRWKGRFTDRRKDGKLIAVDTTISPIVDGSGATLNYVSVSHDVTEELELESQYRQAQKMDAVGMLAGGVAHDLNNLLVPILVNCDLLLPQLGRDPAMHESVQEILEAGKRARDVVRQLLAFSRKQTLTLEIADLNEIVRRFNTLLRRIIREDIEICTRLSEPFLPIRADVGQIEQVIMNLTVNAQDAMPGQGRIGIETSLADVDEAQARRLPGVAQGRYVVLSVSDTGNGMDPATSEKIFEPFFTTKDKSKGTGLGLATVFGIVKQHNGGIRVWSEPGGGSVFEVYLPLAESGLPARSPLPAATDLHGTETVLVVEDHAPVRDLAVRILEQYGYTVRAAGNGSEALHGLPEEGASVQLLLTDVILPGMNGRELYALVAGRIPGIKVLYMSGYTDDVIGDHGVLDAGVHFIQKPFTLLSLAAKVREVLDA